MYNPELLLSYWYKAAEAEISIAIKTNDKHLLRAQLWRVRQAAGDPKLEGISAMLPKGIDEVWLCRRPGK